MPPVKEQRAYPRVNFDTELWLGQEGVFTRTMARLSDVSLGGAQIRTAEVHQVGSVLSLRFALGSDYITCAAIVRYIRLGNGFGVQFLDLSHEDRDKLEAFLIAGEPERRA